MARGHGGSGTFTLLRPLRPFSPLRPLPLTLPG